MRRSGGKILAGRYVYSVQQNKVAAMTRDNVILSNFKRLSFFVIVGMEKKKTHTHTDRIQHQCHVRGYFLRGCNKAPERCIPNTI